jgi:hypothetical protein
MSMMATITNRIYNLIIQNRVSSLIIYPRNIIISRYKISNNVETICFKISVSIMIMNLQINIVFSINSINNSCLNNKFTIKILIFKKILLEIKIYLDRNIESIFQIKIHNRQPSTVN